VAGRRHGRRRAQRESGFPALETYLAQRVLGQADLLARRSTVHDVVAVTDQLRDGLRAEESSHRDPHGVQELIRSLRGAQERAAALKERSARWQHTLGDGVADLNADIDHDLRDRMREITRLAEEEIDDGGDPTRNWDQSRAWISSRSRRRRRRTSSGPRSARGSSPGRSPSTSPRTATGAPGAAHRGVGGGRGGARDARARRRAVEHRAAGPGRAARRLHRHADVRAARHVRRPLADQPVLRRRGAAAGRQDDQRRAAADRQPRQGEAKTAVRRYVDDVTFQVGKDSRDMLRDVQRDLRDHFGELADQLNTSLKDSLATAERSVRTTEGAHAPARRDPRADRGAGAAAAADAHARAGGRRAAGRGARRRCPCPRRDGAP
jgi:hypothetical protein